MTFDRNFGNSVFISNKNEFIAIIGESGAGKTTILNMISMIDKPDSGSISINGENSFSKKDIQNLRRYVFGYIFQNYALIENDTVKENLLLSKKYRKNFKEKELEESLEKVGISKEYLGHKVCVRVAVIVFDFERDVLFLAYLFKARLNVFNYLVKGSVVNIVAYTDGVFFLCVGRAVRGVCVFSASGEKCKYKQRGERKCDYFFHFDLPAFFILDICNVKRSICDYINFSSARGAIFCIT